MSAHPPTPHCSHAPTSATLRDHSLANTASLRPVVVGGDILAYSYVREFHRAYGTTNTIVLATKDIKMLSSSRLSDYRLKPNLHKAQVLYETLEQIAHEVHTENPASTLLVLGCDDCHARMLSQGKQRLEALGYVVPYIDFNLLNTLTQKHSFYELCDTLSIPYPRTWYFDCSAQGPATLPVGSFPYPLIAKPSNSAHFQQTSLKGWRKIYEIDSPEELAEVWRNIKASSYNDELVLQDFIPGSDDQLRTLTTFSDASGTLRVVSGGRVCLQDHDPTALGNPLVILGEKEKPIIDAAARLLAHTKYRGFANFDIKFDSRDGSFRFFEINTRCGRNTYYLSLGGVNFTKLIVDEFIEGKETPYCEAYAPFVYSCVPRLVIKRSLQDRDLLRRTLSLQKRTFEPYPLQYAPDSWAHAMWAHLMYLNQIPKFKRYFWDTHGKQVKEGLLADPANDNLYETKESTADGDDPSQ